MNIHDLHIKISADGADSPADRSVAGVDQRLHDEPDAHGQSWDWRLSRVRRLA
jgi:hypothetical protein